MYANEKKINKLFLFWLISSLILVFLIIIIGGLTRLTDSGLSITEWELFTGLLPPLNYNAWETYFNEYKKIPQYQLLNSSMTIDEFKIIFYWEYFHRILARLIGLFFLIPLIYFFYVNEIDKKRIRIILSNIKKKSKVKRIDTQITRKIWKSMIKAFIDYEYRNFNKK